MTIDLLRTQTKGLLDTWMDREGHERPALLHLLAVQLQPVRMADAENNVKSKITDGPAPWDDQVAHLLADISAGTRTIERGLDIALGYNPRQRGGSDGNTRHALSRIPDLVDALGDTDGYEDIVAEPRITIGAWHRAALLLLGAERRWAHIRAEDEDGNAIIATCPYCAWPIRIQPDLADPGDHHRHTGHDCNQLRCEQLSGVAAQAAAPVGNAWALCINAGCTDEQGTRRAWPVDPWLGQLVTWKRDTTQQERISA